MAASMVPLANRVTSSIPLVRRGTSSRAAAATTARTGKRSPARRATCSEAALTLRGVDQVTAPKAAAKTPREKRKSAGLINAPPPRAAPSSQRSQLEPMAQTPRTTDHGPRALGLILRAMRPMTLAAAAE